MNVLEAKLKVSGNHGYRDPPADNSRHRPLPAIRLLTTPEDGMDVSIGLRPEHFMVGDANGSRPAAVFDLPVRYTEKTGSDATAFPGGCRSAARRQDRSGDGESIGNGKPVKMSLPATSSMSLTPEPGVEWWRTP